MQKVVSEELERIAATTHRAPVAKPIGRGVRTLYRTDADFHGMIVRVDPDGTRTPGPYENRRCIPVLNG